MINSGLEVTCSIYINDIYAGKNTNDSDYQTGLNMQVDTGSNMEVDVNSKQENAEEKIDMVKNIYNWSKSLGEHPIENLLISALNALLSFLDGIQIFLNNIQTVPDNTSQDEEMLYTYANLEDDGKGEDISNPSTSETKKGVGNRDKYTNVGKYKKDEKSVAYVNINNDDYTMSTKIPVIVADFCNVASGKIDFFDANFLTGNKTKETKIVSGKSKTVLKHGNKTIWTNITNKVKLIIRITIYLASAVLLSLLIWHGVHVVGRQAIDNPIVMREHRMALKRFFRAVLLLVSSVIIMALSIFGTEALLDLIQKNDTYELPIRVNVEGAYSFSTTPTGLVRYRASTDNWESTATKARYTFEYFIMVILNVIVVGLMGARMFLLWLLAILGPVFAVLSGFNDRGTIRYRVWIRLYVSLTIILPVALCLVNKILIGAI